ncbi:hypothetical protein HY414_02140 [Candidatus Kaiserbacteria bacterium]|nr:hypothetical protein [Candidatus Kaiserbacteria bacterium]
MTTVLDPELDKMLIERLKELPKVVRDAIESADVEQRLRDLANTHKLHVDQWQLLENEVMLTLLGFEDPEKLAENIQENVKLPQEIAAALAIDISRVVFEPIRQELERELEHPEAKEKQVSNVEAAREKILGESEKPTAPPVPSVAPATPPPAPPTEKALRGPTSGAYSAGEASSTRKDVRDDPYREPPA